MLCMWSHYLFENAISSSSICVSHILSRLLCIDVKRLECTDSLDFRTLLKKWHTVCISLIYFAYAVFLFAFTLFSWIYCLIIFAFGVLSEHYTEWEKNQSPNVSLVVTFAIWKFIHFWLRIYISFLEFSSRHHIWHQHGNAYISIYLATKSDLTQQRNQVNKRIVVDEPKPSKTPW